MTKRSQRWNAALSGVLLLLFVVLFNGFAREHLRVKRDLSGDQLFAPSPELSSRLQSLDDLLVVTAYFTATPEHGRDKIARSRMVSQLKDWQEESGDRMRLEFVDPNSSSAAKLDAIRLGIRPYASEGSRTSGSYAAQEVWWGLSLRYRGRERAIPLVLPQVLEFAFATELFRLTAAEVPRIGLYVPKESEDSWSRLRQTLELSGEVVDLEHLAVPDAIPSDLKLLVVARPWALHPRAAFALDQYVQGGGRLLVAFDNHLYPGAQEPVRSAATGLESLFDAWGLAPSKGLVWDESCVGILVSRFDQGERVDSQPVQYPHWLEIGPAGLSRDLPVTARLGGARLFWPQAIGSTAEAPGGLTRVDMISSSPKSWVITPPKGIVVDPDHVDTQAAELAATSEGQAMPLAVTLEGAFPSPFGAGAPTPLSLFDAVLGKSEWDGTTTEEEVLSNQSGGLAVVIGDSDWLSDEFLNPKRGASSQVLLQNLADWLLLEDDLLALRSRVPRARPLVDYLAEERDARGITDLNSLANLDEPEVRSAAEDEARAAANRRRNLAMLRATGSSLLLGLLLVGLPGVLRSRRRSIFQDEGESA
ncbi:MAG: Gldg family protein [Planctomycetota bacterium]|nr:Gldg family protein [Planctomycetota bacterium]